MSIYEETAKVWDAGSDLLRRVRELRVKATPGPWLAVHRVYSTIIAGARPICDFYRGADSSREQWQADADLIALYHTEWDAILAAVRADERERIAEAVRPLRDLLTAYGACKNGDVRLFGVEFDEVIPVIERVESALPSMAMSSSGQDTGLSRQEPGFDSPHRYHIQPMNDDEFDPANLDPGVRDVVLKMRAAGFDTCDSGDGVSKDPDDRALNVPHVYCTTTHETMVKDANRLAELLGDEWHVQASYAPDADGGSFLLEAVRIVCPCGGATRGQG